MRNRITFLLALAAVAFNLFAAVAPVDAASLSDTMNRQLGAAGGQTGLTNEDPRGVAAYTINIILGILGVLAVALIVYAGFLWLTSQGDETQITEAKGVLRAAVIGLMIILAAYAITTTVIGMLVDSTTGRGYEEGYIVDQTQPSMWRSLWNRVSG